MSRRRQAGGILLLGLLVGSILTYRHLTDEARLRSYAERWLEAFSGADTHIERVRFDLFRGLDLVGVTLAVPADQDFDSTNNSLAARTVFRCETVYLKLNVFSVISGNLVVPEVVAVNPELTLVHRTADGVGNWQVMLARRSRGRTEGPHRLPVIRLRNVRVAQYRLEERGRTGGVPQVIWAQAQPIADRRDTYRLDVTKFLQDPRSDDVGGETGRLEINLATRVVSGSNFPSMSMDDLQLFAPPEVARWLRILSLHGYVRGDTFLYDPARGGEAELSLRDAGLSIPIDADEPDVSPDRRYIRFESMAGTLRIDHRQASVRLTGKFRDSPIQVEGRLTLPETEPVSLDGIGFDLDVTARAVVLPREDEDTDPSEVRFVRRFPQLRRFIQRFDGDGPVDLTLRLHKSVGPGKGVEFVEGTLIARGVSAAYIGFPYRLHDVTGTVHFRRDGKVALKDLGGVHGEARVVVNGLQGGFDSQFTELDIRGENVPLDQDLLDCLSPAYRALCRRFDAQARMNLHVLVHRSHAPAGTEDNPARPEIDVTFLDGSVKFDAFGYPLESLTGRMKIAAGQFTIDHLRARHGPATVEVRGRAQAAGERGPRVDIRLEARDVPLDDTLARALPEPVRERFGRWILGGRADVTGRLFTGPDGGAIRYDFDTTVSDLTLALGDGPVHLEQGRALCHLVP